MAEIVNFINGIIWSKPLIYLCLGTGLFFSIMTRFVQIRMVKEMWRLLFSGKSSQQGISSFQALAVSLSGRVGTGNIAGVGAAIGFGGPGAVFWMWVVAFLGAATAYVESTLAQIYKEVDDGQYRGGPAFYIEKAMGQKWYAWIFAIATIIACGMLLPGVQSNSIGNAAELAFGPGDMIDTFFGTVSSTKIIVGLGILMLIGFIIFGGVRRIANFTQVVVPAMAFAYIIVSLVIIALNIDKLPGVFGMIIADAFNPMAGFGAAIYWGIKRGVYSNEAGQGTGPHAAAAAEVEHPAQQGLVQSFSVYIDTLFVCSAPAFMILITGAYNVQGELAQGSFIIQNVAEHLNPDSPAFAQIAVEGVMPGFGKTFIAVALFFFAFTTILAYYYIAETNVAYLKRTIKMPGLTTLLKIVLMASTFYGVVKTAKVAWALGDIGVGMMAWLNIIGILIIFFMAKPAIKALKDYERQRKEGVDKYTFDPEALGIKNADFWKDRKAAAQVESAKSD
ncbi:MAG: alanine:cation symporter family protein [Algicola sp.]|nr:alanine:cation symporter family protein [Algicola sp.]